MQNGTEGDGYLSAGGVASDGSVVLAGFTTGAYAAENAGSKNRAAKKMRTDFEMGTDGHCFLCFRFGIS